MICRAENRLEDFKFHDAWLTLDRFNDGDLTVAAEDVSIHKTAGSVTLEHDMELSDAKIVFQGIHAITFEPGRVWKTDADGRPYTDDPPIVIDGKEAERFILKELCNGINVYDLGNRKDNRYFVEGCGVEPFFTMEFEVSGVVVEWDGYRKKAWYELHRQRWFEAVLHTPTGRQQVTVHLICHDEDVYHHGELDPAPLVMVGIKYDGKELLGKGTTEKNAFAALQEQLPKDVRIFRD